MTLSLKQARLIKGMTQDQMASKLGVHVQTYRKIESDPDSATIAQAKLLSKQLGISYDEIFFGINSSLTRYLNSVN